jgi:hypothetical protein
MTAYFVHGIISAETHELLEAQPREQEWLRHLGHLVVLYASPLRIIDCSLEAMITKCRGTNIACTKDDPSERGSHSTTIAEALAVDALRS